MNQLKQSKVVETKTGLTVTVYDLTEEDGKRFN